MMTVTTPRLGDCTMPRRDGSGVCAEINRKLPKEAVFFKMDKLMRDMLAAKTGLQVKTQRSFFLSVPNAFTGKDLTRWLQERLHINELTEAQQLGIMLCHLGYICPILNDRILSFKADTTLYRFQKSDLWPTRKWETHGKDYAIYLKKKLERNAAGNGGSLDPHEQSSLNKLESLILQEDWKRICTVAKQQADAFASKTKADRESEDLQEKTFWRLHRPPPGCNSPLEDYSGKRMYNYETLRNKKRKELLSGKVMFYMKSLSNAITSTSKAVHTLVHHCSQFQPLDPLLDAASRCNPWFINDEDFWELQELDDHSELQSHLTLEQTQRWAFDLRELLRDDYGRQRFAEFLRQQFSLENLRFWEACEELKRCSKSQLRHKVQTIINNFLREDAPFEVNLNTTVLHQIQAELDSQVSRFALEEAQQHIFQLMKDDCFPRFLRSEFYLSAVHEAGGSTTKYVHGGASPAPERKSSIESAGHGNSSGTHHSKRMPKGSSSDAVSSPVVLRNHSHRGTPERLNSAAGEAAMRKLSVPPPAAAMLDVIRTPVFHRSTDECTHSLDFDAEGPYVIKKAGSLSSLHTSGKAHESFHDVASLPAVPACIYDDASMFSRQSRHGSLKKDSSHVAFFKKMHF